MSRWLGSIGAILFVSAGLTRGVAGELTIAAASDLKFAFDELIALFETNYPAHKVRVSYGSSGNFYAQINNQAPFDLFFCADIAYAQKLSDAGLALDSKVFKYAIGRLAVWAPTNGGVDPAQSGIRSLLDPSVRKIAIANPQHAPYGRAAIAAMKSLGVYEQAEPKLVFGENIAQTAQFVQSGAADVGIIALSLAAAPQMRNRGRHWEVPPDSFPKLEQGGILLKRTKEPEAARAFRDFVLGEQGRSVLKRHGFFLPN